MRFRPNDIPFWSLLSLPFFIAYNGYGLFGTMFFVLVWALVRQAIVLYDVRTRHHNKVMILESLPISHYVDKVRWSLDKLGVAYEEEHDVGIMGIFLIGRFVPSLRIPGKDMILYNSSDILRYLYGCHGHKPEAAFLKPSEEGLEMEKKIDAMGSNIRRWAYYNVLVLENDDDGKHKLALKTWGINVPGIPQWQKYLLRALFPVLKAFLIKVLNVNAEGAADGLKKSKLFFQETDKLLADGRKFLMNTDEPTFVDISFATLAAIAVLPDQYGGPCLGTENRLRVDELVPGAQKEIKDFRKTPSGKFVLRMFKDHRDIC